MIPGGNGEVARFILENYGPFAVVLYLLWKRIEKMETNIDEHIDNANSDIQKNAQKIRELENKIKRR